MPAILRGVAWTATAPGFWGSRPKGTGRWGRSQARRSWPLGAPEGPRPGLREVEARILDLDRGPARQGARCIAGSCGTECVRDGDANAAARVGEKRPAGGHRHMDPAEPHIKVGSPVAHSSLHGRSSRKRALVHRQKGIQRSLYRLRDSAANTTPDGSGTESSTTSRERTGLCSQRSPDQVPSHP